MRLLSVIIVVVSLVTLLTAWFVRSGNSRPSGTSQPASREIHVKGSGNTLAALAASINDPGILNYDATTRTAIAHASLLIDGELKIGEAGRTEAGETLQMATQACGDLRIEVRPTGRLALHHSTIGTLSQILTQNACSRGYALFVDGNLVMEDSRITYISGSTSEVLRGAASATLRGSSFAYCDGCGLSCVGIDGSRIKIENCMIKGSGNWGLVVSGTREQPLEIRDSVLDATVGAVLIADQAGHVKLIDCALDHNKIAFSQPGGEVVIAWTRRVRVTDSTGKPRKGVTVTARSVGHSNEGRALESRTDERGMSELVLTEWTARPTAAKPVAGNTSSPYEIDLTVQASADKTPVAGDASTARRFEVHGKDSSIIELVLP